MDISKAFITKLIDDGQILQAERVGITAKHLSNDCAQVYKYAVRHFTTYKNVPDRGVINKAFPNFEFVEEGGQPLEYYIQELQEGFRRGLLEEDLPGIAEGYVRSTKEAETQLRELLAKLAVTGQNFRDVSVTETALDRVSTYRDRATNPGADGILTKWESMDYQTLGSHSEEFVVLVGEKYMGKSWILLWLTYQALKQNERVLFVTNEMSQEAVVRRFDSIYANVQFDSLRRGELTNVEEKRYQDRMEELSDSNYNLVVAREGVNTIQDIERKAIEHDSTIIFGDSIYLFNDSQSRASNEVQRRQDISRACKRAARSLAIPFVVSVQAGRKNTRASKQPDLDNIEWSNAFSQDADTVFYLDKDEVDRDLKRAQIWLLKSRDGDLAQFFIDQDFQTMTFGERNDKREPTTEVFTEDEREELDFDE